MTKVQIVPQPLFVKKMGSYRHSHFSQMLIIERHNWGKWDRQIEMDSESGKLDFLVMEALDEKHMGKLKDL